MKMKKEEEFSLILSNRIKKLTANINFNKDIKKIRIKWKLPDNMKDNNSKEYLRWFLKESKQTKDMFGNVNRKVENVTNEDLRFDLYRLRLKYHLDNYWEHAIYCFFCFNKFPKTFPEKVPTIIKYDSLTYEPNIYFKIYPHTTAKDLSRALKKMKSKLKLNGYERRSRTGESIERDDAILALHKKGLSPKKIMHELPHNTRTTPALISKIINAYRGTHQIEDFLNTPKNLEDITELLDNLRNDTTVFEDDRKTEK